MNARLITFEGIEGSGKTVVAKETCRALEGAGVSVVLVREPGGTVVSERIRAILLDPARKEMATRAELFLYLASRAQLVSEVIRPALARGRSIVCDRYMDASVAYQGWARGLGEQLVEKLNAVAVGDAVPEKTFLLDCAVAEGLGRGPTRREKEGIAPRDRLEREDVSFHEKVREGYLRIARREKKRFVVIDASRSLEDVFDAVFGNLEKLFSVRLVR